MAYVSCRRSWRRCWAYRKMICETYKHLLPDEVQTLVLNVPIDDDVSHIYHPVSFHHGHLLRGSTFNATVSQSTSQILSRGHAMTSLHAQNIASSKVSDRPTDPLRLERTRDVRTGKPIAESNQAASVCQGGVSHPSRPTNKPKEVVRVSITQRHQRVRNMKPPNDKPHVREELQLLYRRPVVPR